MLNRNSQHESEMLNRNWPARDSRVGNPTKLFIHAFAAGFPTLNRRGASGAANGVSEFLFNISDSCGEFLFNILDFLRVLIVTPHLTLFRFPRARVFLFNISDFLRVLILLCSDV